MDASIDGKRDSAIFIVRVFTVVNIVLAATTLLGWNLVGHWLAEPLSAASGLSISVARPDWLNPVYAMLWLAPVMAIGLANISISAGMYRLARWAVCYPTGLLAITMIWYAFFSSDYR